MNKQLLSNVTYFGYFFIGIVSFIISPTLPLIIKDFEITMGIAGSVFTFYSAGTFAGVLIGGYFADMLGKKPIIVTGCVLQIAGFVLTAVSGNFILVLIMMLLTGVGRGFLNTSFNALISDLHFDRRGAALNTLHGIYGAGSLVGPLIAGYVISLNFDWQVVYIGAGILWAIFLAVTFPIKYPSPGYVYDKTKEVNAKTKTSSMNFKTLAKIFVNPVFLMLFMVSFIYNGSATGLIGWINTYLDGIDFSVILGAGMVSVFYVGLTIGRFICRFLSEKIGYSKTIILCSLGCLIFYPFAIYTHNPFLIGFGVFFSGMSFSGLHPTGLAYANTMFTGISGTVTGLLSTAMSLGAMSIPWIIGIVAERSGFTKGFSLAYYLIFVLVLVSFGLMYYERRKKPIM